tara:strand:+ start:102 stop:371 length:270 start_codon:yes stop_codon:yes gene_type:complete
MAEEKITWRKEVEEYLGEYWHLTGRPDLFNDVVDSVLEVYPVQDINTNHAEQIFGEAFAFLQTHCTTAISSKDLEYMALAEKERMIFNP